MQYALVTYWSLYISMPRAALFYFDIHLNLFLSLSKCFYFRQMDSLSAPSLLFRREIGTNFSILQFIEAVLEDLYYHETLYEHPLIFEAFTELINLCRKSKSNKILISTIFLDMHPAEHSIVTLSRRVGWRLENWDLLRYADEIYKESL